MLDQIMDILTPRRMMTVGNLALKFDITPETLHPRLEELACAGRIRYAQSRCSGSCASCSTCTVSSSTEATEESSEINPAAIVISLEIRNTEK